MCQSKKGQNNNWTWRPPTNNNETFEHALISHWCHSFIKYQKVLHEFFDTNFYRGPCCFIFFFLKKDRALSKSRRGRKISKVLFRIVISFSLARGRGGGLKLFRSTFQYSHKRTNSDNDVMSVGGTCPPMITSHGVATFPPGCPLGYLF